MANTIQLRRSSVAGKVPTTAQIELGELAINTNDGKVFIKKDDGTAAVIEVGASASVEVRNDSGATINKGVPVYISGTHASGKPNISLADSDGTSTYPAIGLVQADIADGSEGYVVITGVIGDLDTSSYSAGQPLYVSSTAGVLTGTRPTATAEKVQKVGIVTRSHASAGSILVMGAGRTNDVPNEVSALSGVALGATDMGTFTGTIIADNRNIKEALQDLETQVEENLDYIPHGAFMLDYKYSTSTNTAIASGRLATNNTDWTSATELRVHKTDVEGLDLSNFYDAVLKKGHRVYVQQDDDATKSIVYKLSADAAFNATDNIYYATVTVEMNLSGGTPANNKAVTAVVLPPSETDLTYTPSTRVLESSTGTNVTIPEVVAGGDSGLMTGADKTKLDNVTPVNISNLVTLSGEPADSTDLGTFTGTTLSDNTTIRGALQELETAVENNTQHTPSSVNAGFPYDWSTSTGSSPSTGDIRANNSNWSLATNIYVNATDDDDRDLTNIYNVFLKKGVRIYIQRNKDASQAFLATLSADATLSSGVYTLPVTSVTTLGGGTPSGGKSMTFAIIAPKSIQSTGVPTLKDNTIGVHADNAAATSAGLSVGDIYRTSDGTLKVVY